MATSDYKVVYVCKKCEAIYLYCPVVLCGKCGQLQDADLTKFDKRVGRRVSSWWRSWFFGEEPWWEIIPQEETLDNEKVSK